MNVSEHIKYVGVNDHQTDIFESQYPIPQGISYNSYVILDEKIAVMDTVDAHFTHEWLDNVEKALAGAMPDYLVVQHMEPDHSANVLAFCKVYPQAIVVATEKAFAMMQQFFATDFSQRRIIVREGDTLALGRHMLHFVTAPMVHWPEVMVSYEEAEKVLFSADAFGKFGTPDTQQPWVDEARRYYIGIVGKYGKQVQALLQKAAALDIQTICPLHGPILKENLGYYLNLYDIWSSYGVEAEGVFIAYASIHGNTAAAAQKMAEILKAKGAPKVAIADLSRADVAECVEDAFKYGKVILAASSYDAGVFPPMEDFLHHLKSKNYQKRRIGLIENGTWAPCSGKVMRSILETMKSIDICDTVVTIKSSMKADNVVAMEQLADEILA